eukprot:CAMPEP_0170558392 /NCGR_PEP_ID=MMETSP0211-20121228/35067_1 /TAXON_ID=311385 /ORGANISM="Pseudokeronopsis sp., Strain OXSARD2" /LENGTH=53 /DNA_ID=CAMNT_0010870279 /DNA_START=1008 /DNA_END=1169 /DNA_ORIENTATION=+
MTKFLNNDWMYENGFISEQECNEMNQSKLVKSEDFGQENTIKDLNLKEAIIIN